MIFMINSNKRFLLPWHTTRTSRQFVPEAFLNVQSLRCSASLLHVMLTLGVLLSPSKAMEPVYKMVYSAIETSAADCSYSYK